MAVVMGIGVVAQATTLAASYNLCLMLRSIVPSVRCVSVGRGMSAFTRVCDALCLAPTSFETLPRPKARLAPASADDHACSDGASCLLPVEPLFGPEPRM
jgi:hypothetical protein